MLGGSGVSYLTEHRNYTPLPPPHISLRLTARAWTHRLLVKVFGAWVRREYQIKAIRHHHRACTLMLAATEWRELDKARALDCAQRGMAEVVKQEQAEWAIRRWM